MIQIGFYITFVEWINACISDIPFSGLCNESIFDYFNSSNGLQQGCPLSPFLFTIVMDILPCLVERVVKVWNFIPLYSRSCAISHLLFVDDVLIFGRAQFPTLRALSHNLSILGEACGFVMNNSKSSICFSISTKDISQLSNIVNMHYGSFPTKYLRIPIMDSNLKVNNFGTLLDIIYS